jgi:hypothetical protein
MTDEKNALRARIRAELKKVSPTERPTGSLQGYARLK